MSAVDDMDEMSDNDECDAFGENIKKQLAEQRDIGSPRARLEDLESKYNRLLKCVTECVDGTIPVELYALSVNLKLNKVLGEIGERSC